jgi:hypothetical protein
LGGLFTSVEFGQLIRHMHYKNLFWANDLPEPDLRYFSKRIALYLSEKALYVTLIF